MIDRPCKGTPFCKENLPMNPACYAANACQTEPMNTNKAAISESDQTLRPRARAGQKIVKKMQSGRRIGYVRVSDQDQSQNLQLDALKHVGCSVIYRDHGLSGAKRHRPGGGAAPGPRRRAIWPQRSFCRLPVNRRKTPRCAASWPRWPCMTRWAAPSIPVAWR